MEEKNRQEIEKQLESTSIDWDAVVKVSTAHYVFPALYCNLKRADFLQYLPQELVSYMEHITDLNRDRNRQIIQQAKDLNSLLLANNIRPIFLKGTGNLLAGIYDDIDERMVGDIDFIFSKEDYPKAIAFLKEFGYSEVNKYKYYFPDAQKHYRRLQKKNSIAAIEIHSALLDIKKYTKEFNYSFIEKDSQIKKGVTVLSYANKLNLSIIANQINDYGFYYKTMALRNAYDVFLLSKKTNAKEAVNTLDKLSQPLHCFLAACYEVFNSVDSLEYNITKKTASYLSVFNSQFTNRKTTKRRHKRIKVYLFLKTRVNILYKSIMYKEYRVWLFKRVTDKNWYKEKLVQLGLK
ncbi:nucleotidyltransferase family protein [uncultured Polaribacter sp.]|uniref:nucleotidyltransferase domain-containing protein n=1 Tax=uncultured Polaribacter sp. TaxID=174711 RepID=UPI0026351C64|nr:nucleotidyltransferase family protein [uncultured Polaribacter sp.]